MSSRHMRLAIAAVALVAGACSSGGGTATNPPVAISSLTATSVPASTASVPTTAQPSTSGIGGGAGQPTPGAIDPCTLLTTSEASKLMGRTLSAGVSQQLNPDRVCTWKDGLTEVKLFLAPPAPDLATATQYWDAERAQVPPEIKVTDLSLFDRAAYGEGSAAGISLSALFVIDGTQAFDVYCGFPACTQTASVAAAQLVAGRLP